MKHTRPASAFRLFLALFTLLAAPASAGAQTPHMLWALVRDQNALISISALNPGIPTPFRPVSGLFPGDTLRAIDIRPATGGLYALGVDATGAQLHVYVIDVQTFAATLIANVVSAPIPGTRWGMSFNPVVDRIRIVNDVDANLRLNPNNGAIAGIDTTLTAAALVDGVGYDNQVANAASTTLFAINRATNSFAIIGGPGGSPSPNGGIVTDIGPLGVALSPTGAALDVAQDGTVFAAFRPNNGMESLYRINRTTGAAALIGSISLGTFEVDSLAVADPALAISPASGTYTTAQRFDLVFLLDAPGRSVVGGSATFDGMDVSPFLAACVIPGITARGVITFRCPGVSGSLIGPLGHVLDVRLVLNDGTSARASVAWTVSLVSEP